MNLIYDAIIVQGCESRGIKLCGALAAAAMSASWTSKHLPDDQREKYGVVTLIDCRSILDPVISSNQLGKLQYLGTFAPFLVFVIVLLLLALHQTASQKSSVLYLFLFFHTLYNELERCGNFPP